MRIKKSVSIAAIASLCLLIVSWNLLRLPSPIVLLDLEFGWTPTSQTFRLFQNRLLEKSAQPLVLNTAEPRFNHAVTWKGADSNVDDFLKNTQTRAFLVIQDGKIAYERYANGYSAASKFASYSVAKSFVATMVGAALFDGRIHSLQDPIGNYLEPGDVREQYRRVTIEQLLSMRSGIDAAESYDSAFAPVVQMYLTTDLNRFLSRVSGFRHPPGQEFEYRSVDTLVLSKVLTRATGVPLSAYVQQKLWTPLGASSDASWSLDSATHGVEKSFCCLNATARDFAKLGLLYLAEGDLAGHRIVSRDWALAPGKSPNPTDALAYFDGWWIPPNHGRDRDFAAIGIYGQFVYVNPSTHTTIVKLSEYGAEQDELDTLLAMRQIAHSITAAQ
ncbi:serine hydrolase domain-containing protein [Burkholderia glumae]